MEDKVETRVEKTVKRDILKKLLMSDNVGEVVNNEKKKVFQIIPELEAEDGFEHNHPHHCYDVWMHTMVALSKSNPDLETRLAILLHDIGKPLSYQDDGEIRHFHGHPEVGANMSEKILKQLQYTSSQVNNITYLVRYHDTIIDVDKLTVEDNPKLLRKLIHIQYCDAYAHAPKHIEKRINKLDQINKELEFKLIQIEKEQEKIKKEKQAQANAEVEAQIQAKHEKNKIEKEESQR